MSTKNETAKKIIVRIHTITDAAELAVMAGDSRKTVVAAAAARLAMVQADDEALRGAIDETDDEAEVDAREDIRENDDCGNEQPFCPDC